MVSETEHGHVDAKMRQGKEQIVEKRQNPNLTCVP